MIRGIVEASGLDGVAARELRSDLEAHVRDGLDAGASHDELAARLGDPSELPPISEAFRPPAPRRPNGDAREGSLAALFTDLRLTLRTLRRTPTLTFAATAVLGIGISATAVAFTLVNEIFLRPLPVLDQGSLVDVRATEPGANSFAGFSWADAVEYRASVAAGPVLSDLAPYAGARISMGDLGARRTVVGQLVSEDYFPMLAVPAALGRTSFDESPGFGGPRVAILSHALWTDQLGGDPDVLGRTLILNDEAVTVIGVARAGFRGHFIGFPVDLWLPITNADLVFPRFDPDDRSRMPFEMIGRLATGSSAADAEAALGEVARQLEERFPASNRGHGIAVSATTGVDHSLRPIVAAFVGILTALSALVLLVACLNVGSLLLVRTLARESELCVRMALGARHGRLVRLIVTEALVLAASGAMAGLLLSRLLSAQAASLLRNMAPGLGLDLPLDGGVVAATTLVAVLAAIAAALAPSWHVLRRLSSSKLGSRAVSRGATRGRSALVAAQVAVSVALVITTGLFVRALAAGSSVDPGFAADELATFTLPGDEPLGPAQLRSLVRDLAALPGIDRVTLADSPPVGVARTRSPVRIPGVDPPPDEDHWIVDTRRVGAGYLTTLGVRIHLGRDVTETDLAGGPRVAVVNRAFADRFWPSGDPIGRGIEIDGMPATVVGVADDARTLVQDDTPDPFAYVSADPAELMRPLATVRGAAPPSHAAAIGEVLSRYRPESRPVQLVPARAALDAGLLAQRLGATLVGALGAAAMLLAVVGLYGLVAYSVSRDRRELAVRLALGGSRVSVFGSATSRGLRAVGLGAIGGIALAAVSSPALSSFLVGISPRDPLTYGAVVLVFACVAVVACAVPARRALAISPASVLRGE